MRKALLIAGLTLVSATVAAAADPALSPNIFAPRSTPADWILTLALFVLTVTGGIFVTVVGLLVYSIVRFRRRPNDDNREPPQVYGSGPVELAWTTVPVLIVFVLAMTTARIVYEIQDAPEPPGALAVDVIGHQWWWEIRYPTLGIVTANELHVPLSSPHQPNATLLRLTSADVIHSFWVPRLAGKTDLIPNRVNRTWIDPYTPGTYLGQCAEYCGTQHARMLLRVTVHPPEDFARWVAAQRAPAGVAADVAAGRAVFETTACINCHSVNGTVATGRFGPDLTHLMSRETIAAGAARNTSENLRSWIHDPDTLKPGALMPAMGLSDQQVDQLVSYLLTLH